MMAEKDSNKNKQKVTQLQMDLNDKENHLEQLKNSQKEIGSQCPHVFISLAFPSSFFFILIISSPPYSFSLIHSFYGILL